MSSFNILSAKFLRPRSSGFFLLSLLFFVALAPILFLSPQNVYAVDVTLAWDPNSEEDLAGYRVFCRAEGQSYDYSSPVWEGTDTSCTIDETIYELDDSITYYFVVRAFDTSGNESGDSNEVCYQPNVPPVLNPIGAKSVDEGSLLEFTITASDPDGDTLTYSASNLPTGASFDPATQTFSWTPGYGDTGNCDILFTVTDNGTPPESDSETVTITVGDVNRPPVLNTIGAKSVDEGSLLEFTITASDPDGDTLTYSASNLPTGASFDPATQTFSWTPGYGDTGNCDILFTVTDNGTPPESDSETVTITVGDVNRPPVLNTIGAKSVDEGSLLEFTITASDPDGDTLTYSASNLPTGASFDPATQTFSWTPGYGDTGNHDVLFAITDDSTPPLSDSETVTITVVPESNLAPLDPVITSPYYGQMECDLLLLITTEPFSDPDGDLHSQSQWQVSEQDDFEDSLILDVTGTEHLTELPVPHTLLKPDTTYCVRVRFYDVYLEPSDWSDVISDAIKFTTASYNNDVDPHGVPGVPDDQEVDNSVDLNGDEIPDNNQPELIKCIQSVVYNATIGVCKASDSITAIEALETIDPATISDNTNRPTNLTFGLFSYRLSVNEPGATATVRIYFSKDISKAGTFYKYDTINGWQNYSERATINTDGRSVTVELKDGGYGDSDGVANGFIVDPGGLAEASSTDVETSSTSGGDVGSHDGGCFIATAAFGSCAEPHVKLLRDFRDQRLLTNMPGRWFVRMYYRYSPFWADLINIHTWCKPIIRLALMPLVGISYVLIKASVATRILAGLMLALFALGWFLRMPGRPLTGGEQA